MAELVTRCSSFWKISCKDLLIPSRPEDARTSGEIVVFQLEMEAQDGAEEQGIQEHYHQPGHVDVVDGEVGHSSAFTTAASKLTSIVAGHTRAATPR